MTRSPTANSFHSDSGISMRDDSPERTAGEAQPTPRGKSAARDVFEPIFARQRERAASGFNAAVRFRSMLGGSRPSSAGRDAAVEAELHPPTSLPSHTPQSQSPSAAYAVPYATPPQLQQQLEPFPRHGHEALMSGNPHVVAHYGTSAPMTTMPAQYPHPPSRSSSAGRPPSMTGYGLLAANLSSLDQGGSTLTPVYRRFETLNNRLFLHLQDEIAELEEELRLVDEADALARSMMGVDGSGRSPPSSRRKDSRNGKELEWRRLDVLGRIFTKVGHYSE